MKRFTYIAASALMALAAMGPMAGNSHVRFRKDAFPKKRTEIDEMQLAKAEEKRARRAAKRMPK